MKKLLSGVLILISFLLFSQKTNKYVTIPNINKLEKRLNSHSASINTIYSDFTQEKHLEYLNDVVVSEGKFWFKKENKLRWEYTTPFKYTIVINNGKFIIDDGDDIKEYDVTSNKAFQEVNNLIINSVKGDLLKDKKFTVTAFENTTTYKVKLIPKDKEMVKILSKIELYFSKKDLNIFKVKMIENAEDFTIISFKNKKINETIPTSTFIIN